VSTGDTSRPSGSPIIKGDMMKQYKVTYTIRHTRIFKVPDESYIRSILNEENGIVIEKIDEVKES